MKTVKDLMGFKRDRLTVTKYLGKIKYNKHWWRLSCECGGDIELTSSQVKRGPVSCGCYRIEKLLVNRKDPTKHGLHKHPLYNIYHNMRMRCENKNSQRFKYYGAKGIKICEAWSNFMPFYNWAIANGWRKGLSIDRLDSDKDYSPDNCEWITISENSRRMNDSRRSKKVKS